MADRSGNPLALDYQLCFALYSTSLALTTSYELHGLRGQRKAIRRELFAQEECFRVCRPPAVPSTK